jgi:hypothetical protein
MAVTAQRGSSLLPAALLDNHGVPGDWVTGSRTLDVLLLPVIFAVTFPVLRLLLKKYIYQVCAKRRFRWRQLYCQASVPLHLHTWHAAAAIRKRSALYLA